MAQWQCFLSFAVVAASVAASLGAIIIRAKKLLRRPRRADDDGSSPAAPPPWMSCWSRVAPAWLLAFRATAAVALTAVLAWDARTYDPSIMMYYTEYVLSLLPSFANIASVVTTVLESVLQMDTAARDRLLHGTCRRRVSTKSRTRMHVGTC